MLSTFALRRVDGGLAVGLRVSGTVDTEVLTGSRLVAVSRTWHASLRGSAVELTRPAVLYTVHTPRRHTLTQIEY